MTKAKDFFFFLLPTIRVVSADSEGLFRNIPATKERKTQEKEITKSESNNKALY